MLFFKTGTQGDLFEQEGSRDPGGFLSARGGVLCDCSDIVRCTYCRNSKGTTPGGCSDASRSKPVRSFEDGAPDKLERRLRKLT